jgi:hypothetical protein
MRRASEVLGLRKAKCVITAVNVDDLSGRAAAIVRA